MLAPQYRRLLLCTIIIGIIIITKGEGYRHDHAGVERERETRVHAPQYTFITYWLIKEWLVAGRVWICQSYYYYYYSCEVTKASVTITKDQLY